MRVLSYTGETRTLSANRTETLSADSHLRTNDGTARSILAQDDANLDDLMSRTAKSYTVCIQYSTQYIHTQYSTVQCAVQCTQCSTQCTVCIQYSTQYIHTQCRVQYSVQCSARNAAHSSVHSKVHNTVHSAVYSTIHSSTLHSQQEANIQNKTTSMS